MYQQKATQLALLQGTNSNFERYNGKKVQDAETNTDRPIKRTKSSGDATSDAVDVRTESFFSADSEKEPIVKKGGIQLDIVRTETSGRIQNQKSCNYPK